MQKCVVHLNCVPRRVTYVDGRVASEQFVRVQSLYFQGMLEYILENKKTTE